MPQIGTEAVAAPGRPVLTVRAVNRERELTGKERRYLRALAHDLKPIVQIGSHGLSDGVISAIEQALITHELIKVKVGGESEEEIGALGVRVASSTHAHLAQVIGKMLVLYRRRKNKPKLLFPGERPPREAAGQNLARANAAKKAKKAKKKSKRKVAHG